MRGVFAYISSYINKAPLTRGTPFVRKILPTSPLLRGGVFIFYLDQIDGFLQGARRALELGLVLLANLIVHQRNDQSLTATRG